jgi:hypothetical protein
VTKQEKNHIREAIRLIHGDEPNGYTRGMDILAKLIGADLRASRVLDQAKPVPFTEIARRPNNSTFRVTLPENRPPPTKPRG